MSRIHGYLSAKICNHNPCGMQWGYEIAPAKLKIKSVSLIKKALLFWYHICTKSFWDVAHSLEGLQVGNCTYSLPRFLSLSLHWSNLTSARNFQQQGKFHFAAAQSLLCISTKCVCWWIYRRRLMIFTLSPPGTAAVILERQRIKSAEVSNLGICSGEGRQ